MFLSVVGHLTHFRHPWNFKSVVRHLTHFKQMKKIHKVILKLPLEDKFFFSQVRIQNFKIFAKSEFWNLENNNFEISKFKIPKNFKIFPKFFQNFKNGAGPKNSLVHLELWVCHFWRFLDFAIFWKTTQVDYVTPLEVEQRCRWPVELDL